MSRALLQGLIHTAHATSSPSSFQNADKLANISFLSNNCSMSDGFSLHLILHWFYRHNIHWLMSPSFSTHRILPKSIRWSSIVFSLMSKSLSMAYKVCSQLILSNIIKDHILSLASFLTLATLHCLPVELDCRYSFCCSDLMSTISSEKTFM